MHLPEVIMRQWGPHGGGTEAKRLSSPVFTRSNCGVERGNAARQEDTLGCFFTVDHIQSVKGWKTLEGVSLP